MDPLIKSQLLYQLSYAPGLLWRDPAKRAWLSKGGMLVSSGAGRAGHSKEGKSRRQQPAAFLNSGASGRPRWALFATRRAILLRLRVAAIEPARPAMLPAAEAMMTAEATALPFAKARKHDEAMLLTVIQALVERAQPRRRVS